MASTDHGLGPRGVAFYEAIVGDTQVDAAHQVLVVEAARMADRLEKLNDVIAGKGVLELMHFRVRHAVDDQGVVSVEMSIDGVMAEARQLQTAFERISRSLVTGIAGSRTEAKGDVSDDLASKRAARRAAAGS